MTIPEVTTFPLDKDPKVKLTYRNIADVHVQVFRVDLMRLYLMEKSLNNIRGIQLHGIRPYKELDLKLGDGRDFRSKDKEIALELKDPGAYLVVARGGDRLATGMVLRSDLVIEAQEATDVGRIRVNLKRNGAFLGSAHVKVVGSQDGKFQGGDTDLRGVFAADNLIGQATVIAKHGDEYAFFRGSGIHQPQRYRPAPQPRVGGDRGQQQRKQAEGKRFDALRNNLDLNSGNRGRQVEWLEKEVMNKQQKGVEVYRTK